MEIPTPAIFLAAGLLTTALFFHFRSQKSGGVKKYYQGPLQTIPTITLKHEHPTGWGSGAVIKTIQGEPLQHNVAKIVASLQTCGCAIVENMYEDLPVEKLGYEVNDIIAAELAKHAQESSKTNTLTALPGPFVSAVIHSLSKTFLRELNVALGAFHETEHEKTAYTHDPLTLSEFSGFQALQLRLRLPGPGLDIHVDRSSAKLTVLYYLNQCEGGEILLHLLPPENRGPEKKPIFSDGGLASLKELVPVKVTPKMNTLVIFWSDCVPHEVNHIDSNRLAFQVFFSGEAK